MHRFFVVVSVLLGLTLFYGGTGLVCDEGGFGVRLVLKPELSSQVMFGGGEEGHWQRRHVGEPRPWWQQAHVPVLIDGDWEGGVPVWVNLYQWGFAALILLLWPLFGLTVLWFLGRILWCRSQSRVVA